MSVYHNANKRLISETEVINAAWMISAPIVHVGIDEFLVSPRKLASMRCIRPLPQSRMVLNLRDQLRSLASQPLAIQEEVQIGHASSSSAVVLSELL